MSMRYKGGVISATPPTISQTSAPGIWTLQQQFQNAANWPVTYDPYFEYVSMLLPGNGTNGAQNNTFLDSSTNTFSITRNGNTTQGTFSPYGDLWSNYFDTSGDYLFFNNAGLAVTTQDFTAEAWVYLASTPGPNEANVLWNQAQSQSNASQTSWQLLINTDRTVVAAFFSGSTRNAVTTSATIPLGVWTHVAIIRNGSTYSVALNGTLTSSNFGSLTLNSQNYVYIGNALGDNNPQYQLNGYISSARYVRGSAVYTSNFTPPTAPLTAITNTALLTCQSNRFIDNSTNGYSITRTGDVSVQRFSPFNPTASYSTSTIGGSGYFDGTGDYLSFSSASAVEFGTGDYTVEFWGYRTASATQTIVMFANNAFVVHINSSGGLYVYDGNVRQAGSAPLNAWNHYAACRSSGTLKLFVNGAEVYSASSTENWVNDSTLRIGASGTGSATQPFTGYLSNLRIVKGTAVYTAAFTPPTAPVTAITNTGLLLNYTNAGIIDNSMMNDLETVGNAQISTAQSKFGGGSMLFDGTGDGLLCKQFGQTFAGDFTVEFWIYRTGTAVEYPIDIFMPPPADTQAISMYINNSGAGSYNAVFNGSTRFTGASGSIAADQWVHVAMVRYNGVHSVYVNGTANASTYSSTASYPNCQIAVGRDVAGSYSFTGYIDDFRVTNGIARYTANFTPPTAPFFTL